MFGVIFQLYLFPTVQPANILIPLKVLNKHNLPLRYDVISHYYLDIEGMTDPIEFIEQNWKDEQSCVHLFFPMMMQLWNILI